MTHSDEDYTPATVAFSLEQARTMVARLSPEPPAFDDDEPIRGIAGDLHWRELLRGYGECQRCDSVGLLRLVGGSWLCELHAGRREKAQRYRQWLKEAAA